MDTILKTDNKEVIIGADGPFVIIGEKINPSGFKQLKNALIHKDMEFVQQLAMRQVAWGADMLDINVGLREIDEVQMMSMAVEAIKSVVDVPLCIDSNKLDVLEAGLHAAPGKPIVNSVRAQEKQLARILPMVKERGAAFVGLTITDEGIPPTPETRLMAAGKIIEYATRIGIALEDILMDPLVMTIKDDHTAAIAAIKTIELIKKEYGVNITFGASNLSFGLPYRHAVNAAFLTYAMQAGATCAITDPIKLGSIARATDLLLGRDDKAIRYLKYSRETEKLWEQETTTEKSQD
jgi:5-methyltetrahydrofolate--homocysteine methyltransferase